MGLVNYVSAPLICSHCGRTEMFRVCFRYGDVWQHEYRVGDRIEWDRNNVGVAGKGNVVADGEASACPHCHELGGPCEVYLERDAITGVCPASGKFDFRHAPVGDYGYGYIVLSE